MGCGVVADYGHIPAIQSVRGLALHALFDPHAEAAKKMREKHRIPHAFSDLNDFFSSGIDAVSVTSPMFCHKENVLDAAKRGLPVICEKPLAGNRGDAEEMIAATNKAGVSLFTAFCYRFSPCALKIRELVRAKAVGQTRSLRLIYNWNLHGKYLANSDGRQILQPRRDARMREGGPMIDCGTHQIDLAMFWLNAEVVRFSGHGAWVDDYDAPDHMWLHLDHADGAHTVVEISYSYHHTSKNKRTEFVYELIGTEGVIRYDREQKQFRLMNAAGTQAFDFHPEKSFIGMYAEWANALSTGRSDLLTCAEDGMRVVEIAQTATEEARRRRKTR
jgi:predicted dehydrogenase